MSAAFEEGQDILVRRAGSTDDWCGGRVVMVSANKVSIALALDGAVQGKDHGYFIGALAVLIKEGKPVGFDGQEYEIKVEDESREPFELPERCFDCHAILMGGRTEHTRDCTVRRLIERHGFNLP